MGPWQIGCYTRPWAQHDYRVAFDAVAEAGFKCVGLMSTNSKSRLVLTSGDSPEHSRQVGQEASQRGLAIVSVYGGDPPVSQSLQAGIDWLRKFIDNCALAGSSNILLGGNANPKLQQDYRQAIVQCCDYAAEKGIELSLKPHGGLNATGPQCRELITAVGHKNFRLWYDPGNICFYSNGQRDPALDAETVADVVSGMCVKDYVHPKRVDVTPGDGLVDFPAVLAHLQIGGFTRGPLVVETLAPGDLTGLQKEARRARLFVEKLVGAPE